MLNKYIMKNCIRGACQCGKCADAQEAPEDNQPNGHTSDLIFFKVAKTNDAIKEEYLKLVEEEYPNWLDGREHSYLEIGADVGDQGLGLMAMGLGEILGIWDLLTPNLLPISDDLKMDLAGRGMITIKSKQK